MNETLSFLMKIKDSDLDEVVTRDDIALTTES